MMKLKKILNLKNYLKLLSLGSCSPKIALRTGQWTYSLISLGLNLINEKYLILNFYSINNFFSS